MLRLIYGTFLVLILCSAVLTSRAFADGGTITGMIKYEGAVPNARLIHMDADPICYAVNKGNVHAQLILVGDNNTLGNVFVYIKSGLAKATYPVPSQAVVISQAGCNYSPHIIGVRVGQKIKILNPDGTLHNVHAMCKINPEFNASMPDFRKEMQTSFDKAEFMFPVRCDVHPWMQAWMAVMDHPFFDVTGAEGKYEIKNIPAGTYVIEAWHERLESKMATVTVKDGQSQEIDFTLSQPKE